MSEDYKNAFSDTSEFAQKCALLFSINHYIQNDSNLLAKFSCRRFTKREETSHFFIKVSLFKNFKSRQRWSSNTQQFFRKFLFLEGYLVCFKKEKVEFFTNLFIGFKL